MNNNTVNRNNSIDNIRLLAIFGIIVMHCFPFFFTSFTGSKSLAIAINQLTRFGVPCFFTLSGFLYTKRVASIGAPAALKKTASRLIMLYFVWCIFYILPYNIMLISEKAPLGNFTSAAWQFHSWQNSYENFLLGGSKNHLWFLPALLCATIICTPFIAFKQNAAMLVTTALIFAVALLCGPYQNTILEFTLPISPRNGPLFSSVFFAIGAALARVENYNNFFKTGVVLTVIGGIGQLLEVLRMVQAGHNPVMPVYPDFVISTLPFGVGVALIGLSGAAAHNNKPWLWGIGRYTLGIYALHSFVMDFTIPAMPVLCTQVWWQIAGSPLYFAATALLVMGIARAPRLRKFIS